MKTTLTTFAELEIPAPLKDSLARMEFITPTPVQAASIPPAMAGKDILGSAQTGTGKTGAFGIPLLSALYPNPGKKALVLAPTRELAAQIAKVLRKMSEGMKLRGALIVGGESFARQKREIREGADYIVATPGRLIDHLSTGLRLNTVGVLVLDEVDRMLDMGFAPQLKEILPHLPKQRQTLLFSATLPKNILAVANQYLKDPVRVSIGTTMQPIEKVTQQNHTTTHQDKNFLLLKHLKDIKGRVLIFARTQSRTDKVFALLHRNQFKVVSLHGGRTQGQRKFALNDFRSGSHPIMVATDLAGRGIDVEDIECVINYDLPANREDYIHRIGRTARNGKSGLALNYLVPADNGGIDIVVERKSRGTKPKAHATKSPTTNREHELPLETEVGEASNEVAPAAKGAKRYPSGFKPRKEFSSRTIEPRDSESGDFERVPRKADRGARFQTSTAESTERAGRTRSFNSDKKSYVRHDNRSPARDDHRGERGFGSRPPFRKNFGQRPEFGGGESSERRFPAKRPSFRRDNDGRPAFGERTERRFSDRPPFRKPFSDRPQFPGARRPRFERGEVRGPSVRADRRPRFEQDSRRPEGSLGERRPRFGQDARRPVGSFGERRPRFGQDSRGAEGSFGERRPRFGQRDSRGPGTGSGKRPFARRSGPPKGTDRPRFDGR